MSFLLTIHEIVDETFTTVADFFYFAATAVKPLPYVNSHLESPPDLMLTVSPDYVGTET